MARMWRQDDRHTPRLLCSSPNEFAVIGMRLFAATQFWKVPYEQDYPRNYDHENQKFCPAWNGHGIPPSGLGANDAG